MANRCEYATRAYGPRDVKKLRRIPCRGGRRAHGREATVAAKNELGPIGDYCVHTTTGDHSLLVYAEIHRDEAGATAAGFLTRAAAP